MDGYGHVQGACEPSKKRVAFFADLAFVGFGFELSQRHNLRQAAGEAHFRGNDQIPAANRAADSQEGPFNDNFIQIEQTHNEAKNAPQRAQGQKKGTNVVGAG
jgi:hypothetical protein